MLTNNYLNLRRGVTFLWSSTLLQQTSMDTGLLQSAIAAAKSCPTHWVCCQESTVFTALRQQIFYYLQQPQVDLRLCDAIMIQTGNTSTEMVQDNGKLTTYEE